MIHLFTFLFRPDRARLNVFVAKTKAEVTAKDARSAGEDDDESDGSEVDCHHADQSDASVDDIDQNSLFEVLADHAMILVLKVDEKFY